MSLLRIFELPNKLIFNKGASNEYFFQVFNKEFKDAKLSSDKKYVAFTIRGIQHEWSGIYNIYTKNIVVWSFFFDSDSGNIFWSPDDRYIAEEHDSLKEGYSIDIKSFPDNKNILSIGSEFLEKNNLQNLTSQTITKNDRNYSISYEVKFVKWSNDSKWVFSQIFPRCYYDGLWSNITLQEKASIEQDMADISANKGDSQFWRVNIDIRLLEKVNGQ